jgi:hypothetical protein
VFLSFGCPAVGTDGLDCFEMRQSQGLSADQHRRATWRQYVPHRRRYWGHTARMRGHIAHPCGRHVFDHHRRRAFDNYARSVGNTTRQHAGRSLIGHPRRGHVTDHHRSRTLDDGQRQGWMRYRRRSGGRRMDRGMAVWCGLQYLIAHSGCGLTHVVRFLCSIRMLK